MTAFLLKPHNRDQRNQSNGFVDKMAVVSKWKDFMDDKIKQIEGKQQNNNVFNNVFNDCMKLNPNKITGAAQTVNSTDK